MTHPSNKRTVERPVFTFSLVLERQDKVFNGWPTSRWVLAALFSDPEGPEALEGPILLRESQNLVQYMWKGVRMTLYVDAAEGYWYNLLSEEPYAFIFCQVDEEDEDAVPVPFLISASHDEAGAHLETDCLVLSTPLPPDVREKTEQFVVSHYVPFVKKKRKRKNWFKEAPRKIPGLER